MLGRWGQAVADATSPFPDTLSSLFVLRNSVLAERRERGATERLKETYTIDYARVSAS